jgi:RNA polymerase sigma-70 factor (ECF subfamily)
LRRRCTERRLFESEESEYAEPASGRLGPLGELLADERKDKVRGAIAALPEKYRVPLVLAYCNELSYDEIASVLDLGCNQVATLIFRAKKELRRLLSAGK